MPRRDFSNPLEEKLSSVHLLTAIPVAIGSFSAGLMGDSFCTLTETPPLFHLPAMAFVGMAGSDLIQGSVYQRTFLGTVASIFYGLGAAALQYARTH